VFGSVVVFGVAAYWFGHVLLLRVVGTFFNTLIHCSDCGATLFWSVFPFTGVAMGNWLDGDDDSCFDLVIGQHSRRGESGRCVDNISSSPDDENGFRDGLRIEYVRRVRGLVDPFVCCDVGCSLVVCGGLVFTSDSLRIVADYLDELNADWCGSVDDYFDGWCG